MEPQPPADASRATPEPLKPTEQQNPLTVLGHMRENVGRGTEMDVPALLNDIRALDALGTIKEKLAVAKLLLDLGADPDISTGVIDYLRAGDLQDPAVLSGHLRAVKLLGMEENPDIISFRARLRAKLSEESQIPPDEEPAVVTEPAATEAEAAQGIKTYEGPWESHFPINRTAFPRVEYYKFGSSFDADVYLVNDSSRGALVLVKVYKEGRGDTYLKELDALTVLRDLDCVPGIIGHGEPENQFIVREFIKGKNIEDKGSDGRGAGVLPIRLPVKPGQYNYEGHEQKAKETRDWTISSLEALAKIHQQGFLVNDFKFSDFLLGEDGKVTIIDLGNAVREGSKEAKEAGHVSKMKDIQSILRPFFYAAGVGQEVMNSLYGGGVLWKRDLEGRPATPEQIAVLKEDAKAKGVVPAFMHIIDLMEQGNDFAQEYADAMKDYFREVGLYGEGPGDEMGERKTAPATKEVQGEGGPLFVRPIPSERIQPEPEARYATLAKRRGLKPVERGTWFCPDGIEYSPPPHLIKEEYFTSDWERREAYTYLTRANDFRSQDRRNEVGAYKVNNGVVAWVDGNGDKWIGPATTENQLALQEAKYVSGNVFVPFSNGERPVDTKIRGQLNTVFAIQRQEAVGKLREARRELRTPKPAA